MMRVVGFDGRDHKFNFTKNRFRKSRSNKSSYHIQARKLLSDYFSQYSIYEEVTLPGSKRPARKSLLYADFFIPEVMLIVEVHGEQHYKFCSFFHKSKADFFKSQKRDKDKIEWCRLNDIDILILPYSEQEQWKMMISQARSRD
mgnify:CR=1 FL=1